MTNNASRIFVVVPALNEASVIGGVVHDLLQVCADVVVVDDGSRDGTGDRARAAGARMVRHPINLGQGAALQTGIEYALACGADYIVTFDADGQHVPHEIPQMLQALLQASAEVALGSRFLGRTVSMPPSRRALLQIARAVNYLFTGLWLSDAHNGLRLFSRAAAERVQLRQARMAHATEIVAQIARSGYRYTEVPVTITYTAYSLAKGQRMSNSIGIVIDLVMRGLFK